jgi:hypothetical protein
MFATKDCWVRFHLNVYTRANPNIHQPDLAPGSTAIPHP